jgi:hypothetical protein
MADVALQFAELNVFKQRWQNEEFGHSRHSVQAESAGYARDEQYTGIETELRQYLTEFELTEDNIETIVDEVLQYARTLEQAVRDLQDKTEAVANIMYSKSNSMMCENIKQRTDMVTLLRE